MAQYGYTREIGIGAWIEATEDAGADLARMAAFYRRFTARRPENAGPVRFRE